MIPFWDNEFVFTNWFSSGLQSARALMKALKWWQLAEMRWVRLEMMEKDVETEKGLDKWLLACDVWERGVRGLRLTIVGRWGRHDENEEKSLAEKGVRPGLLRKTCWTEGLLAMKSLEKLEIELVNHWTDQEKVAWCRELGESLSDKGSKAKVVCTERVS